MIKLYYDLDQKVNLIKRLLNIINKIVNILKEGSWVGPQDFIDVWSCEFF